MSNPTERKVSNAIPTANHTIGSLARQIADFYKERPHAWTQGECARDMNGIGLAIGDERAIKWCVVARIWKADSDEVYKKGLISAMSRHLMAPICDWQDSKGRTVYDVIELLEDVAHECE